MVAFAAALAMGAAFAQERAPGHGPEHGPGHNAGPGSRERVPPPPNRWYDAGHGHGRYYPAPGHWVRVPPPHWNRVYWSGVSYGYLDGVWYSPFNDGFVVVRPPFGVVVSVLPPYRTLVSLGGLNYFYANGVYYRERPDASYEVVAPPGGDGTPGSAPERLFVYPRRGQSAERQASDEYECHRWAVGQSGFDPTAAATGQANDPARRADYKRAQSACLDGRGYTVR